MSKNNNDQSNLLFVSINSMPESIIVKVHPQFKILNLLIPDKDVGTSLKALLKRFKISMKH